MRISRFTQKTLFGIIALFALIGISTSILSIEAVDTQLSNEYETNSRGIAKTIADASVDIILNRDLSALQSLIDQFIEVQGINYIYVMNETGEFLAHTFVPGIPVDIQANPSIGSEAVLRNIPGRGDFVEVSSPILAGVAGSVHIGMDLDLISIKVQQAIGQQIYLIAGVFFIGIFAAIWLVNLITKPVEQLQEFATGLAKGELGESDQPDLTDRKDELGNLARLFVFYARIADPAKLETDSPRNSEQES